ncbi:AGAP013500-PA [Anopheles gambiae str. PEST]|uniref:AGAP013500-PA n=1 Tax=Anopheles gambiae TaxID=7165 RepID=F5HJQ9_ANOGA|nr:AGAP013500-PA [Anopheles gambiae str. PEST]
MTRLPLRRVVSAASPSLSNCQCRDCQTTVTYSPLYTYRQSNGQTKRKVATENQRTIPPKVCAFFRGEKKVNAAKTNQVPGRSVPPCCAMDRLKAENEELRQELYTVKKKLQVANQISTDLSDELEQQVAKSNRQLEQMRTEHATQLKAQEAQIKQLSKELAAQRSEPPQQGPPANGPVPEHIEETLRMVQEKSLRAKQDWEEDELQYQSEIVQLQQKLTTADRKLTGALTNIAELSEEIELLREQLASKKGNLEIKAQEAEELRDLLEATQQQNGMLTAELAGLRSNSNSARECEALDRFSSALQLCLIFLFLSFAVVEKGNSLFREVADQRKQLMHRYTQLKQRFFQLKSEHEDCPREIRTLRMAQRESQTQYERCVKLVRSAEYYNVQALHEQIKDLTEQLARADRRVRHLEHEMASNSFAWVNVLVEYYT